MDQTYSMLSGGVAVCFWDSWIILFMRHASLFSGIGGFDLAAQWMGWENVFQVEIDEFCQKVLAKNFPNVTRYGDIKQFDGTKYRDTVDILTGGFPCQPFSVAGKRKGKEDDRHLWPQMFRIIREIKPRWIVGENVTGIIGLALDEVLTEMESEGYHTETYIIPACAVNAPHRRDRVWIIAYRDGESRDLGKSKKRFSTLNPVRDGTEQFTSNSDDKECNRRSNSIERDGYTNRKEREKLECAAARHGKEWITTNTRLKGLEVGQLQPNGKECEAAVGSYNQWENWPTVPGVCRRNDGIPNRVDRIKSLGNAIVPQVAFEIFKAIDRVLTS